MNKDNSKKSIDVETIKEFIDKFSELSSENQFVLLGMLKGMAAVNGVNVIGKKGA
ncbi:MAG: hypothetical protein WC365_05825 [Candidatus Babeliales bacterium]|jgi:hypothetical protein